MATLLGCIDRVTHSTTMDDIAEILRRSSTTKRIYCIS